MSAEKRERPRAGQQASPSMSELLASCAAADAVSTPPSVPVAQPDGAVAEEQRESSAPDRGADRDAA